MYFKLKSNILFRQFDSFGYLTDNRNFGYKQTNNIENYIGDRILSESGAVFLSVLERVPLTLDVLASRIQKQFPEIDINTIMNDANDFYKLMELEGFIVSGESLQRCNEKDLRFSYNTLSADINCKNPALTALHPVKSTQEYLEEFFKGKPQLTNLHVEITSICNERCLHCYIPHEDKVNFIDPELFYNILKQCKELKILHLTISGGEPMLHKSFSDFLRKIYEFDISVSILSNLTMLNEVIIEEMKMNPLLGVQVSLYSMDPNIHDEITQLRGSFEKTKKAILKLVENDIPLQINCPILKQNRNSYDEVRKWAENYKIQVGDDFGLIGRYNYTTGNLANRLSIEEVREIMKGKVTVDSNYLKQLESAAEKKKFSTSDDFVCSVCNSSICIADTGNVYPCAGWQDNVVGNVKNTPLKDIWEHSDKVQLLRSIRNKDFHDCIQCSDKDFCTICMVRNANESATGNPMEINEFFCNVARLTRQIVLESKEPDNI